MKLVDAKGTLWDCPFSLKAGDVLVLGRFPDTVAKPTDVPIQSLVCVVKSYHSQLSGPGGMHSYYEVYPVSDADEAILKSVYGVTWLALSDPAMWPPSNLLWRKSEGARAGTNATHRVDCVCKRCNMRNEYAEPNQKDGTYVCYMCRR